MSLEEFWSDSDVHISKLSNEEFKQKKTWLVAQLDVITNDYLKDQYLNVVSKRAGYSLSLPEPFNLYGIPGKDCLAVFSKMHSRAFVRSMRLNKNVYDILGQYSTRFSIRISRGSLGFGTLPDEGDELHLERSIPFGKVLPGTHHMSNPDSIVPFTQKILDPTSIIPFTFTSTTKPWNGRAFRRFIDQMKWPFATLELSWMEFREDIPKIRPWMLGATARGQKSFEDIEKGVDMKIRIVKMQSFTEKPGEMEALLKSFDVVSLEDTSSESLPIFAQIVEKWRSGNWNYRANWFGTVIRTSETSLNEALIGPHVTLCSRQTVQDYSDLAQISLMLVANPDNVYLALITFTLERTRCDFYYFANVRTLSDLLMCRIIFYATAIQYPVDYSGYAGDPDAALDPSALCKLFDSCHRVV